MLKRCLMFALAMFLMAGVWASALAQTGEELIAISQAIDAAFNAQDLEQWLSYFTDDVIFDYVPFPPPITGKDALAASTAGYFQAFPDLHSVSLRVLPSGNIFVEETMIGGTHEGEFFGIPPTGKTGGLTPHFSIYDFEGYKVKKVTTYLDYVTIFTQLGVMPASELPPFVPSFELPDPEATGLSPLEAETEAMRRWNMHHMALWAKMIRPDADIFYNVLDIPMNRDQLVALQELYFLAFPDIQSEIVRMVDMRNGWVLVEAVFHGTHDGPYFGIPGTGRSLSLRVAWIQRFDADGLVTDFHVYFDNYGVLVQLGAVPGPTTVRPTTWGQVKSLFQE